MNTANSIRGICRVSLGAISLGQKGSVEKLEVTHVCNFGCSLN